MAVDQCTVEAIAYNDAIKATTVDATCNHRQQQQRISTGVVADHSATGDEHSNPPSSAEGSDEVRLLDAELAELEGLILLQQRKAEILRLQRQQYLSGHRKLSDIRVAEYGKLDAKGGPDFLKDRSAAVIEEHTLPERGRFENFMVPYARIPSAEDPLVAMEMLTFRLRGSPSGKNRQPKGFNKRTNQPVHVTVIASLDANGMIRLHDVTGEEILTYDSGHKHATTTNVAPVDGTAAIAAERQSAEPAVVVGFSGDASEMDPVIVTAGADGTVRVHTLVVYFRGKRVAGRTRNARRRSSGSSSRQVNEALDEKLPGAAGSAQGGDDATDQRHDSSSAASPAPETAMGVGVRMEFSACLGSACYGNMEAEDAPPTDASKMNGERAAVTSVAAFLHRAMEKTVVIAGYSTGGIRFFDARNGTILGAAGGGNPVVAIKRSGQSIAYTDGQDVRFASVANLVPTSERVCRGGHRTFSAGGGEGGGEGGGLAVTSLAFDALSPGTLYVGSEAGDVTAFNTRVPEGDGSYRCVPSYSVPMPQPLPSDAAGHFGGDFGVQQEQGRCNALSTVRGYLLVSHGPSLSVYNTTEEFQLLFSTPQRAPAVETRQGKNGGTCDEGNVNPFVVPWAVLSSTSSGEALVVEAVPCVAGVTIYKAALPYDRHNTDLSWLRGPILLFGLIVVAITQVYKRRTGKGRDSHRSRSSRRRRRREVFDDSDDEFNSGFDDRGPGGIRDELSSIQRSLGSRAQGGRGGGKGVDEDEGWRDVQPEGDPGPNSRRFDALWEKDEHEPYD